MLFDEHHLKCYPDNTGFKVHDISTCDLLPLRILAGGHNSTLYDMDDLDERGEELTSLNAIFPELSVKECSTATLDLAVTPVRPLLIRFVPAEPAQNLRGSNGAAYIEHDIELSHLPTLKISMTLPHNYPADSPPKVHLETRHNWLPQSKLRELETAVGRSDGWNGSPRLKPLLQCYSLGFDRTNPFRQREIC